MAQKPGQISKRTKRSAKVIKQAKKEKARMIRRQAKKDPENVNPPNRYWGWES